MNRALERLIGEAIAKAPDGTTVVDAGGVAMTITKIPGLAAVASFPRDAVLDKEHIAAAFRTSSKRVLKMDLPCVWLGVQPKYIWGSVLDHVAELAKNHKRVMAA